MNISGWYDLTGAPPERRSSEPCPVRMQSRTGFFVACANGQKETASALGGKAEAVFGEVANRAGVRPALTDASRRQLKTSYVRVLQARLLVIPTFSQR